MEWDQIVELLIQLTDEKCITRKWLAMQMQSEPSLVGEWINKKRVPQASSQRKLLKVLEDNNLINKEVKKSVYDEVVELRKEVHQLKEIVAKYKSK